MLLLAYTLLFMLEGIQSEDAVYVLAYSVIMLNTDLHNPQVLVSATALLTYFPLNGVGNRKGCR